MLAFLLAAAGALSMPAAAGAFGHQRTIFPRSGAGNANVDVALTASGDIWTGVDYQSTVIRFDPTGAPQQTITAAGGVQGLAVNPATQDVFVVDSDGLNYQVEQFTAAGAFVREIGATADMAHPLFDVAVNGITGDVYVTSDVGIARYTSAGLPLQTINMPAADIAVEPATGDVLVGADTTITRLSPMLDNPQTAFTVSLPPGRFITGIAAGLNGELWASYFNVCRVDKISAAGVILRTSTIDCGTDGNNVMEVEADALGGAWAPNNRGMNRLFYFGTDLPTASFTANPGGPVPTGTHVDFTSTSTDTDGTIVSTAWDLDDDGQFDDATGPTAGRTFASAGDFAVRMRVVDDEGGTKDETLVIHVTDQAPAASFTVNPTAPTVGQTVTLTSTSTDSDGTITATDWDLDDDGTADDATGAVTTTSFPTVGDHTVHLRIEDDAGNIVTLARVITVTATPPAPPSLSVTDTTTAEGDSGTHDASLTVTLSAASTSGAQVDMATAAGSAAPGDDYVPIAGTLSFAPGQTTKTIKVPIRGDTLDEADEVFDLVLSDPSGATLGDGSGRVTITDDDSPVTPPATGPENTTPPSIAASGPGTGSTLTCNTGAWTPTPTALATQWLRNDAPIAGATGPTYVVTDADLELALVCSVTATAPGGGTSVARSGDFTPVNGGFGSIPDPDPGETPVLGPENGSPPSISATGFKPGAVLTCDPGEWKPTPLAFAFKWLRGGKAVAGRPGASYVLTEADLDRTLVCVVTATAPSGGTSTESSDQFNATEASFGDFPNPDVVVGEVEVKLPEDSVLKEVGSAAKPEVRLPVTCQEEKVACAGSITIFTGSDAKSRAGARAAATTPKRVLATATYKVKPKSTKTVGVRLTKNGKRLRKSTKATLEVSVRLGKKTTVTRRVITVRPRKK